MFAKCSGNNTLTLCWVLLTCPLVQSQIQCVSAAVLTNWSVRGNCYWMESVVFSLWKNWLILCVMTTGIQLNQLFFTAWLIIMDLVVPLIMWTVSSAATIIALGKCRLCRIWILFVWLNTLHAEQSSFSVWVESLASQASVAYLVAHNKVCGYKKHSTSHQFLCLWSNFLQILYHSTKTIWEIRYHVIKSTLIYSCINREWSKLDICTIQYIVLIIPLLNLLAFCDY